MKNNFGSSLLFLFILGALCFAIVSNPPGGVPWTVFADEPATLVRKLSFLTASYLWPGILSCCAISAFQLQFRLASSGANKRTVFSVCVLASGAMLTALRAIAFSPVAGPSYVAGMALGYTIMSRLYAVRIRTFHERVRLPWPIWRGDTRAVQAMDEIVRSQRSHQS